MSVLLSELVSRLQADVPQRNSVPTVTQYEYAVTGAVADFSRRRPLRRRYDLPVVSGTGSYDLPDDFLRLIELSRLGNTASDVIVGEALTPVPVSGMFEESVTVEGLTLTIRPTPTCTISRPLFYGAAHVLDESDAYPYLTGPEVELVMLRAQASALMTLANAAALEAWKYSLGDESVDKTGLAKTLMEQATAAQKLYLDEMRRAVGPVVRVVAYAEWRGLAGAAGGSGCVDRRQCAGDCDPARADDAGRAGCADCAGGDGGGTGAGHGDGGEPGDGAGVRRRELGYSARG